MRRHGYHPDDQFPDYGDGASWERAIRLHQRTTRAHRAEPLRAEAGSSPASRVVRPRHLARSHGSAVRPGHANGIDGR